MSRIVFGVTRIVAKRQEEAANFDLVSAEFAEAYTELRKACPRGDLVIHLYVEADAAEEVGVIDNVTT